jgi:hypothetical protein
MKQMFPIINEKTCILLSYRFFCFRFVAETDEISNLDLVRDIDRIIKLDEELFICLRLEDSGSGLMT